MNKTIIYNLDDLPKIVAELKALMQTHRIFAFTGSLGAGKTTLIRSLLQACGVTGVISSPTFTYVNIYSNNTNQKFYHFDLYRITHPQEFIDAGFDEYLNDPQAYVFIEWPEIIKPILKNNVCFILLEYVAEDQRSITIQRV
jgi:tRNA threonylcarbamoyladenosine biosynthesis protein TsaE